MSKRTPHTIITLMITSLVSLPVCAREDPHFQLRYIEEINQEANSTGVYQQPQVNKQGTHDPIQEIKTVRQALERLRRYSRPLP